MLGHVGVRPITRTCPGDERSRPSWLSGYFDMHVGTLRDWTCGKISKEGESGWCETSGITALWQRKQGGYIKKSSTQPRRHGTKHAAIYRQVGNND